MIKINNLIPTHNTIRDPKSVRLIVDFLREGRIFRCQDKPICLTKFSDDGKLYIRDGHRRLCAALLAGATDLLDCEYKIEEMSYKDYMTANPEAGWYTPLDPRTECRLSDFFVYKDSMVKEWKSAVDDDYYKSEDACTTPYGYRYTHSDIINKIYNSKKEYVEPRKVNSLEELVRANFPNGCH